MSEIILEVKNLKKHFPIHSGLLLRETGQVKAVDDITLKVKKGSTYGLVGESGCGKSTLGRTISQLYKATAGDIFFKGKDITKLSGADLKTYRKEVQMIFQDPYASLDPRMTVSRIVAQPLHIHNDGKSAKQIQERVVELLEVVGLKAAHVNRYPHEFSGGQRQRIGIARAIALNPELIICDEPVSALDVSIQAQVLNLLQDLQEKLNLTYLFISHDLSVVEHICDEVMVMYLGRTVESAPADVLFKNPSHPYTKALLNAIPIAGHGRKKNHENLTGDIPSPINPPSGCYFHPRCPEVMDECKTKAPKILNLGHDAHFASCLNLEIKQEDNK
ncbi:MAG: dipeptide ABC transporter ATP-binding protein [Bdellovibrionaceae bacterium]|jgi:oligopeptide transport system ATP-binding protein|nr:dipeptide ABC transporter ATP-binding protein [Pseudobdellovibrionaceae bacterium]